MNHVVSGYSDNHSVKAFIFFRGKRDGCTSSKTFCNSDVLRLFSSPITKQAPTKSPLAPRWSGISHLVCRFAANPQYDHRKDIPGEQEVGIYVVGPRLI
ncbi:hypothetical protein [Escherichia coli]|uniref:hypothetical protein n=1 Tax=Escherichia coli TaxID=562 RepID=UPI003514A85E